MSETKHTPGPWHWQKARTQSHLHSADNFLGISIMIPEDEADVANAQLIAAAPELLAELKASNDLLFLLLNYFEPRHELQQINTQRENNIMAIAKAEGKL